MALLCKPAIGLPEHVITQKDMVALVRGLHTGHPELEPALRVVENAGVARRHLVRTVEETLRHNGSTDQNERFEEEVRRRVPAVARTALDNARLDAADVGAVVFASCTGSVRPSTTAWLVEELGCRLVTTQTPIIQSGCTTGIAAINRAADYCASCSDGNVLVIACEFGSLCSQPDGVELGNLVSNSLFGDAVAAAVVRGDDRGTGMRLAAQGSYAVPGIRAWNSDDVCDAEVPLRLDEGPFGAVRDVMPELRRFAHRNGERFESLDYYAIHAGSHRVLQALHVHGGVPLHQLQESWNTFEDSGNIASAAVFDVFSRICEERPLPGWSGLVAGFGPGAAVELVLGTWVSDTPESPAHRCTTARPRQGDTSHAQSQVHVWEDLADRPPLIDPKLADDVCA